MTVTKDFSTETTLASIKAKTDNLDTALSAGISGAIQDGVTGTIKATVLDYTNSNPVAVRLTDANGDYTAAGAGTQYADGAARGTATGTLAMGDDGTNIQSVAVDTSGAIKLAAGTNAIGKLSANSGVDIGDVDITSIAAGTNLIGKVGIDQVTANANEVVVKSAIPAGTNNIGDVDVLTIAAGDNNIGNVDVVTLPAITIAAAQTLATVTTVGAVTSITNALPTGANAIGKLAANSGVDIGDVDVTSAVNATIGARGNLTQFWNGVIDEVRIWNRALSAKEVQDLYINQYGVFN